jgi:hypothetical protein
MKTNRPLSSDSWVVTSRTFKVGLVQNCQGFFLKKYLLHNFLMGGKAFKEANFPDCCLRDATLIELCPFSCHSFTVASTGGKIHLAVGTTAEFALFFVLNPGRFPRESSLT